ncbi:MAG: hypothetical protein PHE18_04995 [Candidatus Omnitrophica bacterium]|nr:hypothetical protein [Candidatus Omnitrophota bacterium]MDD5553214.1 hypothetical protein [Candidatus Omnitrophota bacterium]
MQNTLWLLLASTASVAFFHALAPDHWMPFAAMAKAQNWPRSKLFWITLISGIGHVGISIIFGIIGILLGFSLSRLKALEGHRGEVALWLLIGFGIAYMLWGIKKARQKNQKSMDESKTKTMALWMLFAVIILGPCEPLIPLVFLGYNYGYTGIAAVSAVFSVITIAMMLSQSFLAFKGVQLIKYDFAEKYSHALAGLVIALTGVSVMILGI